MYRCIIIDDEPIAIRVIRSHLSAFNEFEVVAACGNALDAMSVLSTEKIDLMFCDIRLPQLTGVDFVRSLTYPPKVIFTTAYRDYAIDAFELNVIDYLLKPISFERFTRSIQHFLEHENTKPQTNEETTDEQKRDFIFLKADKKHYKVNIADILYFESLGDYVIAMTKNQKIVTKERIGHLVESLPSDCFLQIHRGFIVSIASIETVGPGYVEINKKKIPVGRNYRSTLSSLINDKQ